MKKTRNGLIYIVLFIAMFWLCSCGKKDEEIIPEENNKYTIIFDSSGGTSAVDVIVEEGELINEPTNVKKDGYVLVGWYDDDTLWNFKRNRVYRDIELKAEWEKASYNLNLKTNINKAISMNGNGSYEFEEEVTIQASINDGYTFLGWYDGDNELTNELTYTFNMPSKDATYEARCMANTNVQYKVAHYIQNLENDKYELYESEICYGTTDEVIYAPVKEYEGFTSPTPTRSVINGNGTTIIKYYYDRNYYRINLEKNDYYAGVVTGEQSLRYGAQTTIKATTNLGYTFLGWYDGYTELTKECEYTFTMSAMDISYIAKYLKDDKIENFVYSSTATTFTIFGLKDKSVSSISIPDYVTSIKGGAFSQCSSLESITLPFIGDKRHKSTDTFQYPFGYVFGTNKYDGGIETTQRYYGASTSKNTQGVFYIPSKLNTVVITDCEYLQYGAFYNCTMLTSIVIPENMTEVGKQAFVGCNKLIEFYNLPSLKNLSTGAMVVHKSLDEDSVIFKVDNEFSFTFLDNNYYLIGYSGNESVVVLPDSFEHNGHTINNYDIYEYAFYGESLLNSIKLSNSVINIGACSFYNCSGLTSFIVPKTVISVGIGAFRGCTELESISLPFIGYKRHKSTDTLQLPFGYIFGTSSYDGGMEIRQAYYNLNDDYATWETYFIPSKLKKLVILDCEYVPRYAFMGCDFLDEVYYNGTIEDWCNITFMNSNPMSCAEKFYILDDLGTVEWQGYKYKLLSELVIPDTITDIGKYQFSGLKQLKSVVLSQKVESIGLNAFSECSSLTSIIIPSNITQIGYASFEGCYRLVEVYNLSSSIDISSSDCGIGKLVKVHTSIDEETILIKDNCGYLFANIDNEYYLIGYDGDNNEIVLPEYIKDAKNEAHSYAINQFAFYNCVSLISIVLPNIVSNIDVGMFKNCTSLKEIVIPESVTTIGDYAFFGCISLESIFIPESVTTIGDCAFANCILLTYITNLGNITHIDNHMLMGCSSLISIVLPKSVTKILTFAFKDCVSLEKIYYTGTIPQWNNIEISGDLYSINSIKRYYYSEIKPTKVGNYWYYVDDEIFIW